MADIEATKFYVRHRQDYPETEMQDYARRGFATFGVETVPYYAIDDVDVLQDLGPTVGVAGYIGDVQRALRRAGRPVPPSVDYPPELTEFLGRAVRPGCLGDVRRLARPVFVKPLEQKLFTGFVWKGDLECRRRVLTLDDEVQVWLADPVAMASEYRCFVLDDEVIDVRRYRGDYGLAPARAVVEAAVERLRGRAHRAYCLDFAVTEAGETILVEQNEGFAFGHYGLSPTLYARMLSARWHEMFTGAPGAP